MKGYNYGFPRNEGVRVKGVTDKINSPLKDSIENGGFVVLTDGTIIHHLEVLSASKENQYWFFKTTDGIKHCLEQETTSPRKIHQANFYHPGLWREKKTPVEKAIEEIILGDDKYHLVGIVDENHEISTSPIYRAWKDKEGYVNVLTMTGSHYIMM